VPQLLNECCCQHNVANKGGLNNKEAHGGQMYLGMWSH
jgi:hypothetical protein